MSSFKIPLNLPHAAKVSGRLWRHLNATACRDTVNRLVDLLGPYDGMWGDPQGPEILEVRDEAVALGRLLVEQIERAQLGGDRLGQGIRNLFECLEAGEEGAELSLRAGENPDSLMRPR